MEYIVALGKIIGINIVLSGDNAVVIAMASRCLPPKQQKLAILWGSAGAIVLRILLTLVAIKLLAIPYLQFAGGVLLVWIAAKLLLEDGGDCDEISAADSLWPAVKTIIMADLVMSLDNVMAIAGAAKGDLSLLIVGLALSIPLIIFGSQVLVAIMHRFPIITYAGAGLIAWTAGEMLVDDPHVGAYILTYVPHIVLPALITVGVVGMGYWKQRKIRACAAAGELSK
ncbi:MAG TPA: TerC family protein [Selenomonadales bacterium]|nr:TerC family protein [Selenomonadales bacterium]